MFLGFLIGLVIGVVITVALLRMRRADEGELLGRFEAEMRALEMERTRLGEGLEQRIDSLRLATAQTSDEAGRLANALRRPGVRGRWGEQTLKNVVEAAGLAAHVDFTEQVHIAGDSENAAARPDMVLRLPGGGEIAIDSKVPLDAFLDAVEADAEATECKLLDDHVRCLREKVAELASKAYWSRLTRTPQMVVMFVGSEAAVAAAAGRDPHLLSDAVGKKVMIATPVTMSALLQTVALGWREDAIGQNAEQVRHLGVELARRLETFAAHLGKTSRGLDTAVKAHNDAIGSFENRLLPHIRRIGEHGIAEAERVDAPIRIERAVREPAALEPDVPRGHYPP